MKIYFATDHAGFDLKEQLVPFVRELGYEVEDLGAYECNPEDDYPEIVSKAAAHVSLDPDGSKAIILGGSGQGEAMVANRFKRVRAVVFNGQYRAEDGRDIPHEILIAREHNDSNVLSLGARFLNEAEAKEAVRLWLSTPFSGEERHVRRLKKLDQYPHA
jgi:ribose 5-phosphate isomerase B